MRKTLIVVLGLLLGMVGFTGVSSAHPSNSGVFGTTFVDGDGVVTDDWGDHFGELGNSICDGCPDSWNTDLVMMWQSILVAEGFLAANQVDGQFGPITAGATRSWQARYGIGVDGRVGNQTWSRADQHLLWFSSAGSLLVYRSPVTGGEVGFYRGNENAAFDNGAYELVDMIAAGGQFYTYANVRIQFYSKTTTGPTLVTLAPGEKAPGR